MALPPHVDINLNSDDNNKDTDRLKSSSKALAQHPGTVTLALRLFFSHASRRQRPVRTKPGDTSVRRLPHAVHCREIGSQGMITASNVKTDSRQVDVGDVAVTTFMFSKQTSPRGRLLICGSLNQFCRIVNSQSVSACVETVACLSTCDGFFIKLSHMKAYVALAAYTLQSF